MQVSLDWNQGVGRAVFHLQAIEENLLFRLFQDPELPGWLASWPLSNFKICWVLSHITSLALFLPPTSTFEDFHDYIEPTWLVQDNPPILLISWIAVLIPSETFTPRCCVIEHIHRFWRLGPGHLYRPFFHLPHLPRWVIYMLPWEILC